MPKSFLMTENSRYLHISQIFSQESGVKVIQVKDLLKVEISLRGGCHPWRAGLAMLTPTHSFHPLLGWHPVLEGVGKPLHPHLTGRCSQLLAVAVALAAQHLCLVPPQPSYRFIPAALDPITNLALLLLPELPAPLRKIARLLQASSKPCLQCPASLSILMQVGQGRSGHPHCSRSWDSWRGARGRRTVSVCWAG